MKLSTRVRTARLQEVLNTVRFWNRELPEDWVEPQGITPGGDVLLQCKEEFVELCKFIDQESIRTFFEIGLWSGRLMRSLDYIFEFDARYAADLLEASHRQNLPVILPNNTVLFIGDTKSEAFKQWRKGLGNIDLIFIDGDHTYAGVSNDFDICAKHQTTGYIAIHDIVGWRPYCEGAKKFWWELKGNKQTYIYSMLGIGIWSRK